MYNGKSRINEIEEMIKDEMKYHHQKTKQNKIDFELAVRSMVQFNLLESMTFITDQIKGLDKK